MTFPLKVLGSRAVVKLDEKENKTLGGIIISTSEAEPTDTGVVMAVGDGQRLDNGTSFPMTVKVGDMVIVNPMSSAPVSVPGESGNFIVINEVHILAVIEAE